MFNLYYTVYQIVEKERYDYSIQGCQGKLGIKENDIVIGEIKGDELVLRPLKPKIVKVNPKIEEETLREEVEAETRKEEEIFNDS